MEHVHGHMQASGFVNGGGERLLPIPIRFNLDTLARCLNFSLASRVGCKAFVGVKTEYKNLPICLTRRTAEGIEETSVILLYETGFYIANGKASDYDIACKHIRDILAQMYPKVAISEQRCFHCTVLVP